MKKATKGAIGMPLAVQVVGRRNDEETVLRLLKEIEVATAKAKRRSADD